MALSALLCFTAGAVTDPTYTVSLEDGTEDAANWTAKAGEGDFAALPLEGVAAGTAVTVKYNGTKKVKSVKAVKVKPAATVTTAPTATTGDIVAGSETALVSGGTVEGGTMMYAVTTDNTQPASTNDFSATVPTAEGLTEACTRYVWYYVKADDSHTDSEISATAIEVTIAAPAATVTTAPTAKSGVKAGQNEAIVNAGTVTGGTMMYKVTTANTKPTSTDGFSDTVPTAASLTAGTYYVWYYVEGDASHTDSEISATGIAVTIAAASLIVNPAVGQVIGDDGKNYDYASLPGGVTAVAKICYVSGDHGLALALTDEGQMNWNTAISTCSGKNTSTPVTGATWLLASKDQWDYMLGDNGAGSNDALLGGFSSVGGSNLQDDYYWSSTEFDSDSARLYDFYDGDWHSASKGIGDSIWARACLAF